MSDIFPWYRKDLDMNIKIKIQNMAVLIEFLTGAGLGLFFHQVLKYEEASYVIFGVGVLLSLATWLLREDLDQVRETLTEQYRHSHELTFAIAQINDPECRGKARELVAGISKTSALLRQGYIPLDETEFYLYGAKASDKAQTQIRAVDPMTQGWISRGARVNSSSGESTWANTCSFNFAVYDARVVTDVFTHPGTYYGRKTKEAIPMIESWR